MTSTYDLFVHPTFRASKQTFSTQPHIAADHEGASTAMSNVSQEPIRPLMLGGQLASDSVREFAPLAADLIDHFARTDSAFNSFNMESVRSDLTAVTAQGLRLAIQLLDQRQEPSDSELDGIRHLTVAQARRGVPLTAILTLTDEGISAIRNLIISRAGQDDEADLKELNRLIFSISQRLHAVISVSYLSAAPTVDRTQECTNSALVKAMLAGGDPTHLAAQMEVELASSYLLVRLDIAQPPAHRLLADGQRSRGQSQQLLATARGLITASHGSSVLEAPNPHRGMLLLAGSPPWEAVRHMISKIGSDLGVELAAVAEQAQLDEIPAAAAHTRELALLVRRLGRPAGLYGMEDLALEYQITRCGPGRDRLARLLDPLDATPELLETLSIHLANDLNRQRTASRLAVHTNTVDNRIKKIVLLTGLDPTGPSELLKLRAASIAKAFTRAD